MKTLALVFQLAGAAIAGVPGLTLLLKGLGTPPGRENTFGGLTLAAGVLTLLLLLSFRNRLKLASATAARALAIGAFLVGLFGSLAYLAALQRCTLNWEEQANPQSPHITKSLYLPIAPRGDLERMIAIAGSAELAISRYGLPAFERALTAQAGSVLWTDALLLSLLVFGQAGLVGALSILGLRVEVDGG